MVSNLSIHFGYNLNQFPYEICLFNTYLLQINHIYDSNYYKNQNKNKKIIITKTKTVNAAHLANMITNNYQTYSKAYTISLRIKEIICM